MMHHSIFVLAAALAALTAASPVESPDLTPFSKRADTSCTAAADGFASLNGGTTGGAGGTVVTVSTQADLEKYAKASGKYVIKVKGKITISPTGTEIPISSDKTIHGIGATGEIYGGGFGLSAGVKNVIIRNLKIGNTYDGDPDGKTHDWDGIQADTASNIWVDHCIFERGADGLIDFRKDTNYITVSHTIFRHHNKALGLGWTDNVVAQFTLHHSWFQNTTQRNPSADNLKFAHLYNNYLTDVGSYGHYARGATEMRMENVYFKNTKNPVTRDDTAKLAVSGNVYSGTSGTVAGNSGNVFTASDKYKYTLDATANVPSIVQAEAGPKASICPS